MPKVVSFVTRALTARGYAANGADGLELIRIRGYAVVVRDLRLPDIVGIDVLAARSRSGPTNR